jgi:hypothetical protein
MDRDGPAKSLATCMPTIFSMLELPRTKIHLALQLCTTDRDTQASYLMAS